VNGKRLMDGMIMMRVVWVREGRLELFVALFLLAVLHNRAS